MKLFVAIPIHRTMEVTFAKCLLNLILNTSYRKRVEFMVGMSLIPLARNELANMFMESDCTHLLFLDSDMVFEPSDVQLLIDADLPVVSGLCAKKTLDGPQWCFDPAQDAPMVGPLRECNHVGSGFLMIKRDALQSLPCSVYHIEGKERKNFFPCGPVQNGDGTSTYLSEDWYFCHEYRNHGGKIFVHTGAKIGHIGSITFPVQPQQPTT